MSLTITKDFPHAKKIGKGVYLLSGVIAFDASYPTGGELLTDVSKYFVTLLRMTFDQKSGHGFEFDKTNNKVKVFRSAGFTPAGSVAAPTITTVTNAAPVAVGTNAGALTQVAGAAGITGVQAPAFTGTAVSAAALVEVANTFDLSGLTGVSFIAIGLC